MSNQVPRTEMTSGWVVLAGTVAILASMLNMLYGLTLLLKDEWIVLTTEGLLRFDTTTVGVVFLIFAAILLAVAVGIFNGSLWARIVGIVGAALGIVSQMAFLSVYPGWSWLIIGVNALIIYGLAVHGDEVGSF